MPSLNVAFIKANWHSDIVSGARAVFSRSWTVSRLITRSTAGMSLAHLKCRFWRRSAGKKRTL